MDIAKMGPTPGRDLGTLQGQKGESATMDPSDTKLVKPGAGGTAVQPMLEISPEAREKIAEREMLQSLRVHYDQLPETREGLVEQAKQRIAAGYYDSDEVAEVLSERLSSLIRRTEAVSS